MCIAGSRIFVQEGIYDKFMDLLIAKAKLLKVTQGFDEDAAGGPVVCQ